jgi:signal transduction histidine kinase
MSILTIFSPVVFHNLSRCCSKEAEAFAWFISVLSITAAVIVGNLAKSQMIILFCVLCGSFFYQIEKFEVEIFLKVKKLHILQRDQLREQHEAERIRTQAEVQARIISNVSHDLLSPMQVVEMGLDTLEQVLPESLHNGKFTTNISVISDVKTNDEGAGYFGGLPKQISHDETRAGEFRKSIIEDLLASMKGSLSLMSMMIRRCLDMSKITAGIHLQPNLTLVNISDCLKKSVCYLSNVQNQVEINCHLMHLPETHLTTDRHWIESNLICILSNAVKYSQLSRSQKSAVEVKSFIAYESSLEGFTIRATQRDQKMLIIEVSDSGAKTDDEYRSNLFRHPDQLSRAKQGGAGIGLYVLAKSCA